jgi:hypothetical protein
MDQAAHTTYLYEEKFHRVTSMKRLMISQQIRITIEGRGVCHDEEDIQIALIL